MSSTWRGKLTDGLTRLTFDIYLWISLRSMGVRQRFRHVCAPLLLSSAEFYLYLLLFIVDTMLRCIELFK